MEHVASKTLGVNPDQWWRPLEQISHLQRYSFFRFAVLKTPFKSENAEVTRPGWKIGLSDHTEIDSWGHAAELIASSFIIMVPSKAHRLARSTWFNSTW
jgi:hypothetical protein